MASFLAAVVALAVVALVSAMWRAAARRDEARRLAWLAERDAYYYNGHPAAFDAPLWTAPGVGVAWTPVEHPVAWAPVEHQVSWSPVEHEVSWPPVEHQVAWPPAEQQVAWPPVKHEVALPPVEQVAAAEPTAPSVEQKVACPPVEQVAAAADPTAPAAAGKKGSCAVCLKPTSFRCKSCKSVKYCTVKCQIGHWRQGHKDKCHPLSAVDSKASVVAGVEQAVESKEMPLEFTFPQVTGHEESAVCSSFPAFGNSCIIEGGSVSENVSHSQIPAACDPSKKADDLPETVGSEIRAAVPNNLPKKTKSLIRQQSAPTVVRSYPSESTLFPYERFIKLYNFDKVELRPFGLYNLGNSCYANVVLQCLLFTRPLTAYLLEGLHSKNCSQKEWCFLCELEKLIMEGKKGQSQLSPTGILSHLLDIGSSFGLGKEEDAHEFLRYAIDTMQSASMKEANIKGAHKLAEETTLMQLMFGGYLRSKIKCTKCRVSSEHCERILDLTVEIDGDISTLEEALHRFTSSEVLDGDNRYHCTRCKSYERAKKKLTISEAPNILTIALKRYQPGMSGKINKAIRFPEYLNLSSYMSTTDDCSPVYRLYAVVVHRDVTNSSSCGHYVCYVKDTKGKWYEMDDSQVKSASLENVRSECAYMLLYARFSPRAPRSLRKLIIAQGPSRMRKARQISDAEPTCLEGRSYFSRHQRAQSQSCKDHLVNDSTCTLDRSSTTQSEGSSLISNSDATGNFSTDASTASTRNSGNMEEYDYICGTSDKMHPVSTVVIPEEHVLNYSRQMSSLNPSSSTQCADQGQVDGLQQLKHQASQRVRGEGLEIPSFFYNEQGKYLGSSSNSRSTPSISSSGSCKYFFANHSCKLIQQRNCRMIGEVDHGPGEGQGHFK